MSTLTHIGGGVYSHLDEPTVSRLREAVRKAYPTARSMVRSNKIVTLAIRPEAAREFIRQVLGEEVSQ